MFVMNFDLALPNLWLDVIVPVESGSTKAGSLEIFHNEGPKSCGDITSGESYIYFS